MSLCKSITPVPFHLRTIRITTAVVTRADAVNMITAKIMATTIVTASVLYGPQPTVTTENRGYYLKQMLNNFIDV